MNPNPSSVNPSSSLRRFSLSSIILLACLAAFFVWFLQQHLQNQYYEGILQQGSAALAKKDTARARGLFEAALRGNPTDARLYISISVVCSDFDQAALAVEYAQRGVDACAKAPDSQRAQIYLQLAQSQALAEPAHPQTKAIAAARAALKLDPQDALTQNGVGYILADNGQDLDEADRLLRQALQTLKPAGEDPYSDMLRPMVEDSFGWLLYKKGDYTGAVAALNQASHDMPSGEPAAGAKFYYYHLGAAYRKAGQIEEARRALAIALQYDPTFPEAKAEQALLPLPGAPPAGAPPVAPAPTSSAAPGLKL